MDERQWIRAIQNGEKEYLQMIAEKYYDDIYRFCAYQCGSREDAYDLTQETFFRFIRYVENYKYENLKGYLLTIAMNLCRDHLRKQRQQPILCTEEEGRLSESEWAGRQTAGQSCPWPEEYIERSETGDQLMEALLQLPEMQREAILLHCLQGRKYREIAKSSGVSISTVKSRVKQGMEKLRKLMGKEEFR